MSTSESINIIYKIAKSKMKDGEASNYVGEVITFCLNRLNENKSLNTETFEKALEEEAEFHLKCHSQDVA